MLDSIGGRHVLGLVSNGNSYPERCGLHGRFGFVILAQNVGIEKPDPAIFQAAYREARCSSEQLMHIGDSLDTDVAGARRRCLVCPVESGPKSKLCGRQTRIRNLLPDRTQEAS